MNIISFGLPAAHYFNPLAEGALSPANRWAFLFSEIFANERFMGLFSVLFGAGIVLIMSWRPRGLLSHRDPTILLHSSRAKSS